MKQKNRVALTNRVKTFLDACGRYPWKKRVPTKLLEERSTLQWVTPKDKLYTYWDKAVATLPNGSNIYTWVGGDTPPPTPTHSTREENGKKNTHLAGAMHQYLLLSEAGVTASSTRWQSGGLPVIVAAQTPRTGLPIFDRIKDSFFIFENWRNSMTGIR